MSENSTKSDSTVKENMSYADVVAETEKRLEETTLQSTASHRSAYVRSCQEPGTTTGQLRDQITVDILTIDGAPMKDQLSIAERLMIYKKMGLSGSNYNGTSPGYAGHPVYTFRLKSKIDIREISSSNIEIHRVRTSLDGTKNKVKICCKVRGLIEPKTSRTESAYEPNVRWIKFEETQYKLSTDQIKLWAEVFGSTQTLPEEEIEQLFDEEGDVAGEWSEGEITDEDLELGEDFKNELPPTGGTGTFKVKVKLNKYPPQYLPMFGHKICIHYQGIKKTCTNCYMQGHIKRECTNEKIRWIDYVYYFIEQHPDIPEEYYGRWWSVIQKEFEQAERNQDERQSVSPPSHDTQVDEITTALREIKEREESLKQAK